MVMDQQHPSGQQLPVANNDQQVSAASSVNGPSPNAVGHEFVRQYYTILAEKPLFLHRFYSQNSSFSHGGLENQDEPVKGQQQIHEQIMQLNFRDCKTSILQVDSQSTVEDGVVVQVVGAISNGGLPMRRFTQTFVLIPLTPIKYYVHNDIFRYQDDIFNDAEKINNSNGSTGVANTNNTSCSDESMESSSTSGIGSVTASTASVVATTNGSHHDLPKTNAGPKVEPSKPPTQRPTVSVKEAEKAPVSEVRHSPKPAENKIVEEEAQEEVEDAIEEATHVDAKEDEGQSDPPPASEMTYASRLKLMSSGGPRAPSAAGAVVFSAPPATAAANPAAAKPPPSGGNANKFDQPKDGGKFRGPAGPGARGGRGGGRFGSTSRDEDAPHNERRRLQSSNSNPPSGPMVDRDRGMAPNFPDAQQIFVGNLPHMCDDEELRKLFSKFGKVAEIRINKSGSQQKTTAGGKSVPGFGFVVFEDDSSVANCLKARPIHLDNGHRLNVEEKKTKSQMRTENSGSSGSDRGGRNYDRGSQEQLPGPGGRGNGGERGGRGGGRGGQGRGGGNAAGIGGPKSVGGGNFKKRSNQSFGGMNN